MKEKEDSPTSNTKFIASLLLTNTKDVIPIVEGTSLEDLKLGAAYYRQSSFPGEIGNCVIIGHRETFFNNLGELKQNNEIMIETPNKVLIYSVTDTVIVDWDDKQILKSTNNYKSKLILITCYPIKQMGPVEQKYLVIAELSESLAKNNSIL